MKYAKTFRQAEVCAICFTPMIEKPLFTSFYWECPRCDSLPAPIGTPDHLQTDPLPWEMPNWSDLRGIPALQCMFDSEISQLHKDVFVTAKKVRTDWRQNMFVNYAVPAAGAVVLLGCCDSSGDLALTIMTNATTSMRYYPRVR